MRIAIVNDLVTATEAMRRTIAGVPQHRVVWTAENGAEAVAKCAADRPDLVLMDLIMPVMDGVEATRRIMSGSPCAILVVTADVSGTAGRVFEALGFGALDAVNTPAFGAGEMALLAKIDLIGRLIGAPAAPANAAKSSPVRPAPVDGRGTPLVAMGASAGGPLALAEVLKQFGQDATAAFVIVQHLDEQFARGFADWLAQQTSVTVRLAREGDVPERGVALLPARDDHLVLTARGTLSYTAEPAQCAYRPSVDVFFSSVAENCRGAAAGVLLTGMGRDGAIGLKKMREARMPTMAQDRETSAVYGMPKAAAESGAAEQILPLTRIAPALQAWLATLPRFQAS